MIERLGTIFSLLNISQLLQHFDNSDLCYYLQLLG